MSTAATLTVLWVVPVPDFGGVARHVLDVARTGIPGYRLVVCAPEGKLTERLRELNIPVHAVPFGPSRGFRTSFASLAHVIEREKPTIVHSHLAYADVIAAVVVNSLKMRRLANRSLTVPTLITTEHGIAGDDAVYHGTSWRSKLMEQVHRVRLWGTNAAIAVSRSTAEQMRRKWGARRVSVIYNGVDAPRLRAAVHKHRVPTEPDAPRILSLSRLSPEKGIDVLIEAFAQLRTVYPKAHLEIAGEGDLADTLAQQVRELHISDAVTFSGFVDPLEAMGRSDMVVQLSIWENCSYTLLDAKAAGLKTVATKVGGNPEILAPNELVDRRQNAFCDSVLEALMRNCEASAPSSWTWVTNTEMTAQIAELYTQTQKHQGLA
ncbi:glycosyltransferase [Rothia dentocariosa]|uniref:glycosyltransferase n=1 Tax=Rothia dentocariosa TaxID=2047 RepID=UPI0014557543|nr:glycosyltransferase [Rothia dentocariosa]NLR25119.1 glycosyltransferase [Rothia dentocariosa]